MGNIPRSYAAGSYFLTLDGVDCGSLHSAWGGEAVGTVVSAPGGPGQFADKQIGSVHHEDLVLEFGLGMGNELYEWIEKTWQLEQPRRSGSIDAAAFDGKVVLTRTFTNALVSEVTVPKLDGSSKDPGFLTVRLAPEQVTFGKGGGQRPIRAPKQKLWVASGFRVDIDGLDCKQVMSVDSFTVRQGVTQDAAGEHLEPATTVEFPNLKITLSAASAATWQDWHEEFVVKGNNGPDQELAGSLVFLAPTMTELARIELSSLGILALRRPPATTTEQVAKVVAELYCERMSLHVGG